MGIDLSADGTLPVTVDILGMPRPGGSGRGYDIGAFEFQGSGMGLPVAMPFAGAPLRIKRRRSRR